MTPDIQFLINCCNTEHNASNIKQIRIHITNLNNQQLSEVTTLAHAHGTFPLVYQAIQAHASDLIAEETLAELKQQNMTTVMKNMRMTAELIHIMRLLEANGIEALALKGPALAQLAYGNITHRQYSDLDIFIQRKGFRKFIPTITGLGYTPFFPVETFTYDKVMFDMNNDCPFYNSDTGISIELHWDFFRKLAIPTERFNPWRSTDTVTINNIKLPVLNHESHLLYHSLHGSKHIWEKLIWIVDIDRFIRAKPTLDWDEILLKSKEMGSQRMFLFGVALAIKFFQTPVPQKINQLCIEANFKPLIDFVEFEFNKKTPTPEDSLIKLYKIISLRDNIYYKTITLLDFVFRPGINERRTIILQDQLFWLYWIIRPFGMGFRFIFCRLLNLDKKQPSV